MLSKKFIVKLLLVFMILGAISCKKKEPEEKPDEVEISIPDEVKGVWKSAWDSFVVTDSKYSYYADATQVSLCIEGDIEKVYSNNEPEEGYLVLSITNSSSDCGSFHSDYSYFVVGQYTVVRWQSLNGNNINHSNAYVDGSGVESELDVNIVMEKMIYDDSNISTYFGFIATSQYGK